MRNSDAAAGRVYRTTFTNMSTWTVSKSFAFEAAHSLPHLPPRHKCHNPHGHSYVVVVVCKGPLLPHRHWVIDYAEISRKVKPLIKRVDHQNLNKVLPCVTTAERIAEWFYNRLKPKLPSLHSIELRETRSTNVIFCP